MVAAKDESRGELNTATDTYRRDGDWESEPVSAAVVEAVSNVTNTPPTELDPLYNVINPDALDLLYKSTYDGTPRVSGGSTTFTYNDCRVTVHADGEIEATRIPEE